MKKINANKVVFLIGAVLATHFGGSKGFYGRVNYPRTDPEVWYVMDNGSYVTNDAVHVAIVRNLVVPSSANFFLYGLESAYTNDNAWAEHAFCAYSNTFDRMTVPFDFAFPAASNYNWIGFTDWVPPPVTHTNGVAYVGWQIGAGKAINELAPYKTGIYADGAKLAPSPAITNGPAISVRTTAPLTTTQEDNTP